MPSFSTDERQLLHDSLQDYFGRQYPFEHFRELTSLDHSDGFDRTVWQQYAELGWLAVALPEEAGGSNGGITELGIVMAAAGAALACEPLLATVVLGAGAISAMGTSEQQLVLGDIAAGNHLVAFCHYEPDSGYAREHVTTIARSDGDGFVLTGRKGFSLHADSADTFVVTARLGSTDGPMVAFTISGNADGLDRTAAPTLDARRGAALTLDQVRVPSSALLGRQEADQTQAINTVLDRGTIAVCAEAAGAMTAVTGQTVEYLKSREQFGQPLSKFQVLQHRLVDMNIATEEARAATHAALQALDDGDDNAREKIWKAKVQSAKSARFVGSQAIQLHGGMGMTDELAIGHYYKRLCICETMFGDGEWYIGELASGNAAA